jgi:anti-sigma B factor antagonist
VARDLSTTTTILVEPTTIDAATVVILSGDLDLADTGRLRRTVCGALSPMRPSVVLDISRVGFLDCSVLGVLVTAHTRATLLGGRLVLVGARRSPRLLLRMTGLDNVFTLHESLASATT